MTNERQGSVPGVHHWMPFVQEENVRKTWEVFQLTEMYLSLLGLSFLFLLKESE